MATVDGGISPKNHREVIYATQADWEDLTPAEVRALREIERVARGGVQIIEQKHTGVRMIVSVLPVPSITMMKGPLHAHRDVQSPRESKLHRPTVLDINL